MQRWGGEVGDGRQRLPERELAAIEARAAAATPGPWEWSERVRLVSRSRWVGDASPEVSDDAEPLPIIVTDGGVYPPHGADRPFLAHARTDVPTLLAEVRRLRALLPEGA